MPPTIKVSGNSGWELGGNGRGHKFIACFKKEANRLLSVGLKAGLKGNINKTASQQRRRPEHEGHGIASYGDGGG